MVLFYQRHLLKSETLFALIPRKGFSILGGKKELGHVLSKRKCTARLQISYAALHS